MVGEMQARGVSGAPTSLGWPVGRVGGEADEVRRPVSWEGWSVDEQAFLKGKRPPQPLGDAGPKPPR